MNQNEIKRMSSKKSKSGTEKRERHTPCSLTDFAPRIMGVLEHDVVNVWRLPTHISQSRLGDRTVGSNACTIIALKMAEAVHVDRLYFCISQDNHQHLLRKAAGGGTGVNNSIEIEQENLGETSMDVLSAAGDRKLSDQLDIQHYLGGCADSANSMVADRNFRLLVEGAALLEASRNKAQFQPRRSERLRQQCTAEDIVELNPLNQPPSTVLALQTTVETLVVDSSVPVEPLDPSLVNAVANSILDGNQIHEWAVRRENRDPGELNFTIPDAIGACRSVFRELDYKTVRGPMHTCLVAHIHRAVKYWHEDGQENYQQPHLFLLVIAHERTVLVVYQPYNRVIGLVDSHSHGKVNGALLASSAIDCLSEFCLWMIYNVFPESLHKGQEEQEFEISIIRYLRSPVSSPGGVVNRLPYATRSQTTYDQFVALGASRSSDRCSTPPGMDADAPSPPRPPSPSTSTPHTSPEKRGKIFEFDRRRLKRERAALSIAALDRDVPQCSRQKVQKKEGRVMAGDISPAEIMEADSSH